MTSPTTAAASYAAMIDAASVAYAMSCAERDAWIEARRRFWASTGRERAYWRGAWREMIQAERRRLQRQRDELAHRTQAGSRRAA